MYIFYLILNHFYITWLLTYAFYIFRIRAWIEDRIISWIVRYAFIIEPPEFVFILIPFKNKQVWRLIKIIVWAECWSLWVSAAWSAEMMGKYLDQRGLPRSFESEKSWYEFPSWQICDDCGRHLVHLAEQAAMQMNIFLDHDLRDQSKLVPVKVRCLCIYESILRIRHWIDCQVLIGLYHVIAT